MAHKVAMELHKVALFSFVTTRDIELRKVALLTARHPNPPSGMETNKEGGEGRRSQNGCGPFIFK